MTQNYNEAGPSVNQFGIFIRAAGLMRNEDRVLLSRAEVDDVWVLPGGSVKLYETTEEAIQRELLEEMGFEVQVERLLWMIENIFNYTGDDVLNLPVGKYHDIHMVYSVHPKEMDGNWVKDEFYGVENDWTPGNSFKLVFRWFSPSEIDGINLVPACMKHILKEIPTSPKVVVSREE